MLVAAVAASLSCAPALADAAPAAAAVYEAGRCIVGQDRAAAAALMRRLPLDDSAADLSPLQRSRARACAAGAAGASANMVRGAIAQELFLRDFRSFGGEPRYPDRLVDLDLPVQGISAPGGSGAGDLYRWADCVVRNDPANVERLLRSPVGSTDEAGAIAAVQPYMSACFAAGAQVAMRASQIRGLFAQGAYFSMYRIWTGQLQRATTHERN